MKKVLILAYDFPPYVSVGGLRPYSWYNYFKEFGLYPIVVTRQWGNKYGNQLDYIAPSESSKTIVEETEYGTIIRTPYKPNLSNHLLLKYGEHKFRFIRKIISAYYEFTQFLFFIGPKSEIYRGAKDFLKHNKVDLIIATGDPFVLFKYASVLSINNRVPWVADYRDTWIQDKTGDKNSLLSKFYQIQERSILQNCKSVTTVSDFLISHISENVKNKKFDVVLNGFDSEGNLNLDCENSSDDMLTIAFAGTIYDWHPWERTLICLNNFAEQNQVSFRLNIYGVNIQKQMEDFAKINISNSLMINFYSKQPNNVLLKELSKANVLLLFNDYSILGTKIFDYIAVRRKILFCFSEDDMALELKKKHFCISEFSQHSNKLQEELIIETNSGIIVKNELHLREVLKEITIEFNENQTLVCDSNGIEAYSRRNQAKKLVGLLESIIGDE